jgi:hypothetical protein
MPLNQALAKRKDKLAERSEVPIAASFNDGLVTKPSPEVAEEADGMEED